MEPFSLREQVAFVTGAAGGVGRGIVRVPAAGADIVIFDNDEQPAREVAGAVATCGVQGIAIVGDVASPTDVKQAVERTLNIFNRFDILVNNAAIVNRVDGVNTVLEQDLESWQRVMAVNRFGAFLCIKEVLPAMITRQ